MNKSDAPCLMPPTRGDWSRLVRAILEGASPGRLPDLPQDPLTDDDLQLALYLCYELHYRGVAGVADEMEWDPDLLRIRRTLEQAFEAALVEAIPRRDGKPTDVPQQLRYLDAPVSPFARFMANEASLDQFREFVVHRSSYHLKEADPHTFALPRVGGIAKAAFAEIQGDEYGSGRPERVHARLFATMMDGLGLDTRNGAYLEAIPGTTLAGVNLMSLFGLHRKWRGAAVGHLALFELGSPRPNRAYGAGLRRLGFGPEVTDFHDEHVEADAIHSMIATYDLAGRLAEEEPELASDMIFGAQALRYLEDAAASRMLAAWNRDESSLISSPAAVPG